MAAGMETLLNTSSVKVVIQKPIEGSDVDMLCNESRSNIANVLLSFFMVMECTATTKWILISVANHNDDLCSGETVFCFEQEAKVETKPEEKKKEKAEVKKDEKPEEKKEEEKPPSPSPPIILFVDLHCVGCAKKIERSIMKCRGVEGVEIDMVQDQVTVKGLVDPKALCSRIQKTTMRQAKVVSPLPPAEGDSAKSDDVTSQGSGLTTVELKVNMHCEACAQQLRRKILKMRGVQMAETELSSGKVMVTGTMNADRLVEYVYQRTRKLARIVPQPPKEEAKKKEEGEKKGDEKSLEEKKEEGKEEKKEEEKAPQPQDNADGNSNSSGSKEEKGAEGGPEDEKKEVNSIGEEDGAKKMMYWAPVYVIEQLPPPQLFSDENPNACCIS